MKAWSTYLMLAFVLLLATNLQAADGLVKGRVIDARSGEPILFGDVLVKGTNMSGQTDERGYFEIEGLADGDYTLIFFMHGYVQLELPVLVVDGKSKVLRVNAEPLQKELDEYTVESKRENNFGIMRLRSIEGTAIYAGKKSEVVYLDDLQGNKATNNSRQVYSKVAGLNIWESDGAGLQLGIGARGLSPNRTSNFNTRQNGYDMSADALGYPESYYSPPIEAVERIEVVRGAASLQYGTQFGGLLNFKLREANKDKPLSVLSRQTVGSFGLFSSFTNVSGTKGKVSYNAFYQYKTGDGWRDNSNFDAHTAFGSVKYRHAKLTIGAELTVMRYLAQQPGGLTDAMFEADPSQTIRERNWFQVKWNLAAVTAKYDFSKNSTLDLRSFMLLASRESLGFLGSVGRLDQGGNRNLIDGRFTNVGHEIRYLQRYKFLGLPSAWLTGVRVYNGHTRNRQGMGADGSEATFGYIEPDNLDSDFDFPSQNYAAFTENLIRISKRFTVTPGFRFEHISTNSEGYYANTARHPLTGEILSRVQVDENLSRNRSLGLFGLGISYEAGKTAEVYMNASQNYRAINFNDIRINNPTLVIDPDIMDERGHTLDLGLRGNMKNRVYYDLSAFMLSYKDRLGSYLTAIPDEQLVERVVRYRTNVSDARNLGVEGVVEVEVWKWITGDSAKSSLSVFGNFAFVDARYIGSEEAAFTDKRIEDVPNVTTKSGVTYRCGGFATSLQYSYTSDQYSDATNAEFDPTAVAGLIPAYSVTDFTASYTYRMFKLEAGINNLTDERYFTRRATGYPGPGIIPSDARNFFVTLQLKL